MKNIANRFLKWGLLAVAVTPLVLGGSSLVLAKGGGGHGHAGGEGHKSGMPFGFSKGEKKGWKGEKVPPGWSHGEKKGWDGEEMPPGLFKKQPAEESETE